MYLMGQVKFIYEPEVKLIPSMFAKHSILSGFSAFSLASPEPSQTLPLFVPLFLLPFDSSSSSLIPSNRRTP